MIKEVKLLDVQPYALQAAVKGRNPSFIEPYQMEAWPLCSHGFLSSFDYTHD